MTVIPLRPEQDTPSYDGVPAMDLCVRARITYRQLDYWTRTGRLHPNEDAPGSGNPRTYPASEVAVACLLARIVDAGLSISPAERAARELLATGTTVLAGIRLELPHEL